MNKSLVTNLLAAALVVAGYLLPNDILFTVGLFALSGAVTNWLAVHMLFEKVPGLYGSGVIPARFEEFKSAIARLMMEQFFTRENIDRFLSQSDGSPAHLDLGPVIDKVDLEPSFNALVDTVAQSSLGGMLAMFGGTDALQPLKEPFIEKMKASLKDLSESEQFYELLKQELEQPDKMAEMQNNIEDIVRQRLDELTPQMVKIMVQQMIREHLGWLVVWGGVFGGVIGFAAALMQS
ncbi:DUF445 domain-containing protein [Shewanella corallii]|uniref:DUF445 domain-containing protein n=2 Tax=Shewanella TaxID=22 RepID=A0ABT0NB81_9GAMM|nr:MULTISPECIES: DUF445 domain-containing protein [Shewanella]MCL1039746.1 DUF445 domain-containing protein [Shewanella submarina]MCL2915630.1 DUF445 domain-containing protein [Shewanella corallii]